MHEALKHEEHEGVCFVTLYGVPLCAFKYYEDRSCEWLWSTETIRWELGGLGFSLNNALDRINSRVSETRKNEKDFKKSYFSWKWSVTK